MLRPLRLLRKTALLLTSPLWLPILILALITEVHFLPQELLLRHRMRKAGRYRPLRSLAGQAGTFISDSPTFSWAVARLWWTPDDVLSLAPAVSETQEERSRSIRSNQYTWHPFDRWLLD